MNMMTTLFAMPEEHDLAVFPGRPHEPIRTIAIVRVAGAIDSAWAHNGKRDARRSAGLGQHFLPSDVHEGVEIGGLARGALVQHGRGTSVVHGIGTDVD